MEQQEAPKTFDRVQYSKDYYQKHKDEYKKEELCEICGHTYKLNNKSNHKKLKKHMIVVERLKIEKAEAEKVKAAAKILKELDELKSKIKEFTEGTL
jgi:arginine/lysine/ornithine decarboxylase